MSSHTRSPSTLLLLFLSSISLFCSISSAQGSGYHSKQFDSKYIPYSELLITPISHPGLFSFTGRWHRRREMYTASAWPGTSVTSLVYGDRCIIKFRPEKKGVVNNFAFYVSIDGQKDMLYTLPSFNSSEPTSEVMYVGVRMAKDKEGDTASAADTASPTAAFGTYKVKRPKPMKKLRPHTVRITSVSETPFSFEGLLVHNTLVRQGMAWIEKQDERTYVEFIGEGVDAETRGGLQGWTWQTEKTVNEASSGTKGKMVQQIKNGARLMNSVQYRVSETLGFRHVHISSGACLVSECDPSNPLPGLAEQYFNEDPIPSEIDAARFASGDSVWKQSIMQQWPFLADDTWVRSAPPQYVVVDLGVRDLLLPGSNVEPEKYQRTLMVFLAKVRHNARPGAAIMVVARDPDRSAGALANSLVPDDEKSKQARKSLFKVTVDAVEKLRTEDPNIFLLPINPSKSPFMDLATALCASMVEPFVATSGSPPSSDSSSETSQLPTKAQSFCHHISAPQHRIIPLLTPLTESIQGNLPASVGGHKDTKHLEPPHPHHRHHHEDEDGGISTGWVMLYALALCVFAAVLAFLLARPVLMMLARMGVAVPGQKRVFGVRGDPEGGVVEFGIGKRKGKERDDHHNGRKGFSD